MRDWLKVNSILCSMAMVLKCIALTLTGPLLPTSILEKILLPLLHTFRLGPVNHLVDHLGQLYPELEQHLADLYVVRED